MAAKFLLVYAIVLVLMPIIITCSSLKWKNIVQYDDKLYQILSITNVQSTHKSILPIHIIGFQPNSVKITYLNDQTGIIKYTFMDDSTIKLTRSREIKCSANCSRNSMELTFHWKPEDLNEQAVCLIYPGDKTNKWFTSYVYEFNNELFGTNEINLITSEVAPFGPAFEPIFLHKDGFALIFDDLHLWKVKYGTENAVNGNIPELCFHLAKPTFKTSIDHADKYYSIKFKIIMGENLKSVHENLVKRGYLQRLQSNYPEQTLKNPIFPVSLMNQPKVASNGIYKQLNVEDILALLRELHKDAFKNIKFPNIHTDLTSIKWHTETDEFTFNPINHVKMNIEIIKKSKSGREMPNPGHMTVSNVTEMMEIFHQFYKCQLSIAVSPVFSPESVYVKRHGTFFNENIQNSNQKLVDLSNTKAIEWLGSTLQLFVSSNEVDGLICSKGDVQFQQSDTAVYSNQIYAKYPNFLTTRFIETCSAAKPASLFATSAFKSQLIAPVIILETAKREDFTKTADNTGIKQIIKKIIRLSLAGYPMVMPKIRDNSVKPDMDWYERWLLMAACMPVMHIPVLPQQGRIQMHTIAGIGELIQFRNEHIVPHYVKAIKQWINTGEPVIRPMWYVNPDYRKVYELEDQFMVGENLLVAPLMSINEIDGKKETRTVYFPTGNWKQPINDTIFIGPGFYNFTFSTNLIAKASYSVPYFKRIN